MGSRRDAAPGTPATAVPRSRRTDPTGGAPPPSPAPDAGRGTPAAAETAPPPPPVRSDPPPAANSGRPVAPAAGSPPPSWAKPAPPGRSPDWSGHQHDAAATLLRFYAWITSCSPPLPPVKRPGCHSYPARRFATSGVQFPVEPVSGLPWNPRPVWDGMPVQFAVEYADRFRQTHQIIAMDAAVVFQALFDSNKNLGRKTVIGTINWRANHRRKF